MKLFGFLTVSGLVSGSLLTYNDNYRCLQDCGWAMGCEKCYDCFADPSKTGTEECLPCVKKCTLAWGCMDCLVGKCNNYDERCSKTKYIAPCFKNPELPGCPDMGSGNVRQCGLGLACDNALFTYIKSAFSPCNECLKKCSVCRPCIHCLDDPTGPGCDECEQCEPCTGCAACVTGQCPVYAKCTDCTLCMHCLADPEADGCDQCEPCKPCVRAIGCFEDTKNFAKLIFGYN